MGDTFPEIFFQIPQASGAAPEAVNLLGSHTDYSHGFILATAAPGEISVELAESRDGLNHFHILGTGNTVTCSPEGTIPEGPGAYIFGCLLVLQELGFSIPPVCALVRPHEPVGSGLSGGASLQVAVMRALRSLFRFNLDDVVMARLAHRAEAEYADVNCGIVEQMTVSLVDPEHMLFLDARSLDRQLLLLPDGSEVMVVDSGVSRSAAEAMCTERRGECEEACRRLRVPALRDVTDVEVLSPLPPLLRNRARYVVTENARVLEAAKGVSARRLGNLMNDSHAGLRDDFAASTPEVDLLAELLRKDPRVFGARLTGAGFGRACVALVEKGALRSVADEMLERYRKQGGNGRLLIP